MISHTSAAVAHGLPHWAVRPDRVHATRNRGSGARRSGVVQLHAAVLLPDEVTVVGGLPCAASSQSRLPLRGVHGLCEDDGAPQEARGAPRYVPKYQRLPSGSRIAKSREP